MDLLSLIVVVAILGFALWLVTTYVPMPAPMKTALLVIVILLILIWVARIAVGPVRIP